jgi:hypothetical protein
MLAPDSRQQPMICSSPHYPITFLFLQTSALLIPEQLLLSVSCPISYPARWRTQRGLSEFQTALESWLPRGEAFTSSGVPQTIIDCTDSYLFTSHITRSSESQTAT